MHRKLWKCNPLWRRHEKDKTQKWQDKTRKAKLTQRETHNSAACLKAQSFTVTRGRQTTGGQLSIVFYFYSPEGVTCLAQPTPYRLKIANFSYSPTISTLVWGDHLEFMEQLYASCVFQAADGEDSVILACTVFDWSTRVMDKRTDRRTDRIAMAKTRYTSSCRCA